MLMATTVVGRPVAELDTPVLLVDLPALEQNIEVMAAAIRERGTSWRPHVKVHKTPAIAHKQLAAGAIGVACAKLGEAEVLAASGIRDIMIANQIVGPIKTRRLMALCRHADVIVAVDDPQNVAELDAVAKEYEVRPRIVVEVDTGMGRCGVAPGADAIALAQTVASHDGLRFAGFMSWEGQTMSIADNAARPAAILEAVQTLTETAEAAREAGLPVEIVSCGGTATFLTSAGIPGVTEVQAGGGIFGDPIYRRMGVPVAPALTLLTQVISRARPTRIVLDFGRKQIDPSIALPEPRGINGAACKSMALHIEHAILELEQPSATPRLGERVELDVGFGDRAIHLHEHLYGIRDGIVETVWPVAARGRHQ
jgi:D-serine deaminase-like pyridoxal phosphate-dependent protein